MKLPRMTYRVPMVMLLSALSARTAVACSLRAPWEINDPSMIAFIGTPRADTVRAGAGLMNPEVEPGHSGRGAPREAYGQRVRIDRLGAHARRELPPGVMDVVLVPWDYAAHCAPVAWNHSARWLADEASGLFRARLRPRAHWADGLPTFDVLTTSMQPYRDDPAARISPRARPGVPRLSAEALLAFYDRLPALPTVPDSAAALAFARALLADTALAGRYPVPQFLIHAQLEFDRARAAALRIPIAGTFRLELASDTAPSRMLFLRTAEHTTQLQYFSRPGGVSGGDPGAPLPVPDGYYVKTAAAATVAALPATCAVGPHVSAYMDIAWHPPIGSDGLGAWTAGLDPRLVEGMLSRAEVQEWRQRTMATSMRRSDSLRSWADSLRARGDTATLNASMRRPFTFTPYRPLRVVQRAGSPMRIEGMIDIAGLGAFRVRGERISPDALACPS